MPALTLLTALLLVPGIFATGSLWADDKIVAAKSLSLHHPSEVKSIIFYYCKGGPAQAHTFDKPRQTADPALYPLAFRKCGQSGLEIGDVFPHLQKAADSICRILLREPTADELPSFTTYAQKNSLAAFCRVLINSNEFPFVN